MHILFLSHNFPPEVNAGATRTYEHCKRWVAAGHEVTVIACPPHWPKGELFDGYRNRWRSEEVVDGIRVLRVWTYIAANEGFLKRALNFVSYLITAAWAAIHVRNVDVVVSTSPHFFCGFAGVLVRAVRPWPFVLEVRDIWPESIAAVGAMRKSLAFRVLERLERLMYDSANHIVTVGDGYRQKLLERGVPAAKITVVTNGVDLEACVAAGDRAALRKRWNSEGAFVCSYVGTVGMAHGLDVMLDAARMLKRGGRDDVRLWIVGDGADRRRLEQAAKREMLDNVVFTGLVPKHEVMDVIAASDACLVHLKGTELFGSVIPSKIFETMALGVPIVMGVRGQSLEIVRNARAGVAMTPDDPESLLVAVEAIRTAPHRYRSGRAYVAKHFNRDDRAALMLDVLARHAARKPAIARQNTQRPTLHEIQSRAA